MPTKEDALRELTFKGEVPDDEIGRRVYYTLSGFKASDPPKPMKLPLPGDEVSTRLHRAAKSASLLAELLIKKRIIATTELDELLLESTE